jgi:hypothetical protein
VSSKKPFYFQPIEITDNKYLDSNKEPGEASITPKNFSHVKPTRGQRKRITVAEKRSSAGNSAYFMLLTNRHSSGLS